MMEEWQRERGRLGAAAMHAKYDGKAVAARTMAGRLRHYEQQIDPTGALKRRDPQALARRVEAAMQADMAKARLSKATKRTRRLQEEQAAQERAARDAAHAYAAMREQLTAQLRQIPPNDIPQLAALVLALRALDEQPF